MRPNNFDLIRLLAALQVVLFHGIEHLRLRSSIDAISPLIMDIFGAFPGVPIFFVISGYLISKSLERDSNLNRYAVNRLLRIYPGLYFCFFFSVCAVALVSFGTFANASTLDIVFWSVAQLTIAQFYNPEFLRSFGVGVLNGSLWTISVELQFYLVLPIVYHVLQLRHKHRTLAMIILTALFLLVSQLLEYSANTWNESIAGKLISVSMLPYFWIFLVGVVFQRNWNRLQHLFVNKFSFWLCSYCLAGFFCNSIGLRVGSNNQAPVMTLVLAATILAAAFSYRHLSEAMLKGNDISYGIYIYHMIFVNLLLAIVPEPRYSHLLLVVALTLVAATCSWFVVEAKFLKLKPKSIPM